MYHDGNKSIIEASDIQAVVAHPDTLDTLSDGRQMLTVGLILDPARNKHYAAGEFPTALHVTDGVNPRLLPFGDLLETLLRDAVPAPEAIEAPGAISTDLESSAPVATTSAADDAADSDAGKDLAKMASQ